MPRVTLDRRALEALASESRIAILRVLVDRQCTLTQVARALDLDKAGVYRHLQKLLEGRLVQRDDRFSFTYYRLTWRGRGVVAPRENVAISFLLGFALLSLSGAIGLMYAWLQATEGVDLFSAGGTRSPAEVSSFPWVAVGMVLTAVLVTALAARRLRPRRRPLTEQERHEEVLAAL